MNNSSLKSINKDIEYPELRFLGDKTSRVYAMRKSRAQILRQMTPAMRDAEKEIERAFMIIAGHLGYGISDLNYVKGRFEADTQWQQEQIDKYNDWSKQCSSIEKFITLDFILGYTRDEIAVMRKINKNRIVKFFINGLNNYCIMMKWGNQIEHDQR